MGTDTRPDADPDLPDGEKGQNGQNAPSGQAGPRPMTEALRRIRLAARLQVDEPDVPLVWRGRTLAAQFEVAVPADAPAAPALGRLHFNDALLARSPVGHPAWRPGAQRLTTAAARRSRVRRSGLGWPWANRPTGRCSSTLAPTSTSGRPSPFTSPSARVSAAS